jgi:tetratricopeptide (TPR) repeat protein
MTEPSTGADQGPESLSDVERTARIEQLLVSGLDEYFAGRLDHAINVWTRVLFLDRANDRARAYIDRARRALAERQRETEALLEQGLQAFDSGDVESARRLLTAALERGAPHEQALPVLHRIGLLAAPATDPPRRSRHRWRRAPRPADEVSSFPWRWLAAVLLLATAGAGTWIFISTPGSGPAGAAPMVDMSVATLPLPGASEAYLVRAQALFAAGRLPDALAAIERIAPGDSAYAEAQVLRGRMQQELLRAAGVGMADPGERTRP